MKFIGNFQRVLPGNLNVNDEPNTTSSCKERAIL